MVKLPNVIPISFEKLTRDTHNSIIELANALDMQPKFTQPLLPAASGSLLAQRLTRLLTVRPQSSAIRGSDRAPRENWKKTFTKEDRQFFHDQAGDLLIKLGYETSDAWIENPPPEVR